MQPTQNLMTFIVSLCKKCWIHYVLPHIKHFLSALKRSKGWNNTNIIEKHARWVETINLIISYSFMFFINQVWGPKSLLLCFSLIENPICLFAIWVWSTSKHIFKYLLVEFKFDKTRTRSGTRRFVCRLDHYWTRVRPNPNFKPYPFPLLI